NLRKVIKAAEKFVEDACRYLEPHEKFDAEKWLAGNKKDRNIQPIHEKYGELVNEICNSERVDYRLITGHEAEAIINNESSGKPLAGDKVKGLGLMGLEPATALKMGVNPDSLTVPYWNLLAGIRYLNYLVRRYDDLPMAIVAYSCGEQRFDVNYKNVNPHQAVYYQKIKALMDVADEQLAAE
ncbi:MAG TPA: lytic transglycosylase domain-containing protein, partial [Candidatus Nanoarchaeia archaeon]|nr:lytic transglycosylase domain-containing protein [Candidatus Nanoarchaeia archaeon]